MQFGITLKGDVSVERILELTRRGEQAGFQYGWIFDSHVIWKEPYPLLTLMAANTTRMHLGTCVTNPAVRDVTVTSSLFATLNLISHGRMELGIGRGDSSRRVLGKKPTTLENLEETVAKFRELTAGREIEYDGRPARLPWATGGVPRVWIAAYGPKALNLAGKIGDGVILQLADPDVIEWCLGFVREGAKEAGRDPSKIEVMSAAAVWVSKEMCIRDRSGFVGMEARRWRAAKTRRSSAENLERISGGEKEELDTGAVVAPLSDDGFESQDGLRSGPNHANPLR